MDSTPVEFWLKAHVALLLLSGPVKSLFDDIVFSGIIKPIFSIALLVDKERLPTLVLQAVAALIGLSGLLAGKSPGEFFAPNVPLTSMSNLRPSYEFIVVGGGITGCLMAKRLSDAGHTTVLIHGPGSIPNELTRVPLFNFGNQGNPDHDFRYRGPPLKSGWEG